jgi:hypothetical protein
MLFFRIFSHLLPRSQAWRVTVEKTLRKFFLGLAEEPEVAKQFADQVFEDLLPATTRIHALNEWEKQFGLALTDTSVPADVVTGRLLLAAEWQATGGQSPSYVQGVLQAAGFDLYVHDWWSSGPPYVARDPRDYTNQPLVGTYQCTGEPLAPLPSQPQCSAFASQPQCNRWLANEVKYLVNKDLTRRAPPPIPDDEDKWPYFFYVGAETFPELAIIPSARRSEFERLILKLRPLHVWIVTRVAYVDEGEEPLMTEDGFPITTEDDELIFVE